MSLFGNLSAVHLYMSLAAANMSSLAKIADEETFNTVLKASIHPMVQLNILKKYLKLTKDPKPKTTVATRLEKLWNVLLPNPEGAYFAQEPRQNATRLLPPVVWIKLSRWYLNEGSANDACQLFDVQAKQLSKVLSGKVYLRGTAQKKMEGCDRSKGVAKEVQES